MSDWLLSWLTGATFGIAVGIMWSQQGIARAKNLEDYIDSATIILGLNLFASLSLLVIAIAKRLYHE